MAERPLLILPTPESVGPPRLGGGGSIPIVPSKEVQKGRLAPRFQRLRETLNRGNAGLLELRDDPTELAPDRVIVFEVAGSIADFARAAEKVPGLELLAEYDTETEGDEVFAERDTRVGREGLPRYDKKLQARFYLAMPTIASFQQLLGLYDRWAAGRDLPPGLGPFKHLFAQLRVLRPWGPEDRIPDETIEYWLAEAARRPGQPVRTEVELWFHRNAARQQTASAEFRQAVEAEGGTVIDEAIIPEIAYHGALVDIPAGAIPDLVSRRHARLAVVDDVMFLRPQTVFAAESDAETFPDALPPNNEVGQTGLPIAALLDGMPLQAHERLAGRLLLDDPDDLQAES